MTLINEIDSEKLKVTSIYLFLRNNNSEKIQK